MNKREKFFKILKFTSVFLAVLNAIFFFAMKCCWSGLSSFLKYGSNHIEFLYYLPPIVSGLFFVLAIKLSSNNKIPIIHKIISNTFIFIPPFYLFLSYK